MIGDLYVIQTTKGTLNGAVSSFSMSDNLCEGNQDTTLLTDASQWISLNS